MDDDWEPEAPLSGWLQALNTPFSHHHFGLYYAHVSLITQTYTHYYIIFHFYFYQPPLSSHTIHNAIQRGLHNLVHLRQLKKLSLFYRRLLRG